jgi:hypothetical protein
MTTFSLRQAAQEAGTSKSTILRAIQSGRLSATRTDDGGYSIDPAELFRVYPRKPAADQLVDQPAGQDATAPTPADMTDLLIRQAQLEAAFSGVQAILEAERRRAEELRTERDRWAAQAERLALPAPQAKKRTAAASWSAWFRQPLIAS